MTSMLVVGFDACDPSLAKDLVRQGRMPVLASLIGRGAWSDITLPDALFVGTVWPVLTREVHSAATHRHSWINVDPATYELLPPPKRRMGGVPFWDHCLRAGHNTLLIDVPHAYVADTPPPLTSAPLTMICEWGSHDHHVGFETYPSCLAEEIFRRFGAHPLLGTFPGNAQMLYAPDDYLLRESQFRTPAEDEALIALIASGIQAKTAMSAELLNTTQADLNVVVFGDSHAVGHQLWHVHDPSHPRHHPGVASRFGSPLEMTYTALDQALGDLIEAADPTNVVVLLSHGMGPHYDGTHLLEPLLGRLDQAFRRSALSGRFGSRLHRIADALLSRHRTLPPLQVEQAEIGAAERRQRHFFRSWNNDVVGGVRVNLIGREAEGLVHPRDQDAVLDWLETQLQAVTDAGTGAPAVRRTYRLAAILDGLDPAQADPLLPDLFVEWNRERSIETVSSPVVGEIHHSVTIWRTGDHVQRSAVVFCGPDFEVSTQQNPLPAASVPVLLRGAMGVSADRSGSSP